MFLRLCGPPSIPLSFNLAVVLALLNGLSPTASCHRLLCGLPGYLILFDTRTFVHQRQSVVRQLLSQSVFCVISKHFTATLHIPPTAPLFKKTSFHGTIQVRPELFTTDLIFRLRTL